MSMGQVERGPPPGAPGDIGAWGQPAAQGHPAGPQKGFLSIQSGRNHRKYHNSALCSIARVSLWLPPQEGQIQPFLPRLPQP